MPNTNDADLFLAAVSGVPAHKVAQVLTRYSGGQISFVGCSKGSMAQAFSLRLVANQGYESIANLSLDDLTSALALAPATK